jgi:histidine triad (HIT) family protein
MSLHGTYDPDNIFARILRGDIPAAKVWEDEHVLVLMDAFPQSEGHLLVIPKASQARNLLEAEPEVLARLIAAVQRTSRAAEKALAPDAITVMQFNGAAGGQSVFHLHFHVVPRWADRPLKAHGGGAADTEALKDLAGRIAAELD